MDKTLNHEIKWTDYWSFVCKFKRRNQGNTFVVIIILMNFDRLVVVALPAQYIGGWRYDVDTGDVYGNWSSLTATETVSKAISFWTVLR